MTKVNQWREASSGSEECTMHLLQIFGIPSKVPQKLCISFEVTDDRPSSSRVDCAGSVLMICGGVDSCDICQWIAQDEQIVQD